MNSLLALHSSGRITRSITRRLTARFIQSWQDHHPKGRVVERDLTAQPPPVVDEAWIAAAFAEPPPHPTPEILQLSEALIDELAQADVVVMGAPVYNFGVPAQLKAWIDQIVRVGRTFAFDPAAADPYRPLLRDRSVVIITSAGDGAIFPGGLLAHMNHLEPHLITALGFIGLTDLHFIRAGYDEFQDDRKHRSLAQAEQAVDDWVHSHREKA